MWAAEIEQLNIVERMTFHVTSKISRYPVSCIIARFVECIIENNTPMRGYLVRFFRQNDFPWYVCLIVCLFVYSLLFIHRLK